MVNLVLIFLLLWFGKFLEYRLQSALHLVIRSVFELVMLSVAKVHLPMDGWYYKPGCFLFMRDEYQTYLLVAAGIALCMFVGAFLFHKLSSFFRARTINHRRERGEQGEVLAKKFLIKHGYEIIQEQPRHSAALLVDGEERKYEVRADFLVARRRRRYVVEVKTGKVATNPASSNTRRQLFEYSRVYDVDGLLFFNAESRKIMTIAFPGDEQTSNNPAMIEAFIWGAIIGAIATAVAIYFIK